VRRARGPARFEQASGETPGRLRIGAFDEHERENADDTGEDERNEHSRWARPKRPECPRLAAFHQDGGGDAGAHWRSDEHGYLEGTGRQERREGSR
jgi:hypothetical protein